MSEQINPMKLLVEADVEIAKLKKQLAKCVDVLKVVDALVEVLEDADATLDDIRQHTNDIYEARALLEELGVK